jgi:hypothetical protein
MIAFISVAVLEQLQRQLSLLQPHEYNAPLTVFNGASIGAHTRHVLEFYECLLNGYTQGVIDYDARKRNMSLQDDLHYALACAQRVAAQLLTSDIDKNDLTLRMSFGPDQVCQVPTTFVREEVYLIEHSIHHFALIRIGIQTEFGHVAVEPDFGIAYSTIQYRAQKTFNDIPEVLCAH